MIKLIGFLTSRTQEEPLLNAYSLFSPLCDHYVHIYASTISRLVLCTKAMTSSRSA